MKTQPDQIAEILYDKLQQYFGYKTFRRLQPEIINHLIRGNDAVVLMPTGGGKSLCYQLPALVLDGLTLVVSPLIALMKDQVQSLQANGITAAYLNSSLSLNEKNAIRQKTAEGEIKLLYIAPESIFSGNFIEYVQQLNISLIAIDEAHCVSSWGHHFRPEYRKLAVLKEMFPDIPIAALTATADKAVRSDIGELLKLRDPVYFIESFDRPNLSLAVLPGQKKWEQIIKIIDKYPGKSGIIYCGSRSATENLEDKLQQRGVQARAYHAGLNNEIRSQVQDDFIQGTIHVICATIAFGMGIDKADVRYVIHYNMPGNLESYYQEIGRAGRDGLPAETVLFYSYRDVQTHMGFIEEIEQPSYKKIQLAKLQRMQEYAEAQVCRRKILLTYFSEIPNHNCGNCDVCDNPPEYFDGSTLAQMALSAIARLNERIGISALIDVLKGTYSPVVVENNYSTIKTFGVGKATTAFAWQLFVQQFIQQGIVEIDYKDHYTLKITSLGKAVLFEGKEVLLVTPETIRQRQERQKQLPKTVTKKEEVDQGLFAKLRQLRTTIAEEIGKPAYVVFSDATLQDMCDKMPRTPEEFLAVSGVGEHKARLYSDLFISTIIEHAPVLKKLDTYTITRELYNQGKTVADIAKERDIREDTVYGHLAKLLMDGEQIEISNAITEEEIDAMRHAVRELGCGDALKPFYEHFEGALDYGKIKLILAYFSFEEKYKQLGNN